MPCCPARHLERLREGREEQLAAHMDVDVEGPRPVVPGPISPIVSSAQLNLNVARLSAPFPPVHCPAPHVSSQTEAGISSVALQVEPTHIDDDD